MHFTDDSRGSRNGLLHAAMSAMFSLLGVLSGCASRQHDRLILVDPAPSSAAQNSRAAQMSAPSLARSMEEYQIRAAEKIRAANLHLGFSGELPDPLASIPVLQVHLRSDGSVKKVEILRTPHFYPETVQTAIQAIERAQPFGSVAHLPEPWQFNETFLFNEDMKFQLRTLVEWVAQK